MATLELTLNLPDDLAQRAKEAGLLSNEAIEKLLREQLRRQAGEELRAILDRVRSANDASMSEDEVQAEIRAYRAEQRAKGKPSP
jgi:hypothetical protein